MKRFLKISSFVCFSLLTSHAASTPAAAQATGFEDLSRQLDATPIATSAQLRADANALDGKVVALQGEIAGIVTREGTRTVLLKIGDDMTILTATPETPNPELLRTGTLVGVLARVVAAEGKQTLVILATTETLAADDAKTVGEDGADISLPVADGTIAPPKPATKAPPKKPAPKTAGTAPFQKGAAALPVSGMTPDEAEDLIAAQAPAYAAIVRRHNKKLSPAVVQEISVALLRAGYQNNMDPRFLAAIIAVESDFDVFCKSSSGAMGLGQMMPFNLKEAGVKNPWNPTENVMGTARLLRGHLNDYKDRPNGTLLAVAAYNAGPGAVRRAGYKVPKGAQVQRYVWKVYYRYKEFAPDMF